MSLFDWWRRFIPFGRQSEIDGAAYLRSIVMNLARSGLRRRRLAREKAPPGGVDGAPADTIVLLRDFEGLSYDEIADVLQLESGTVKSRLHRARMELKALLEPYLAGEG